MCPCIISKLDQMYGVRKFRKNRKCVKDPTSSVKRVSHLSRRTKRQLYYKLQMWLWRRRQENCCFAFFQSKRLMRRRRTSLSSLSGYLQRNKGHLYPSPILQHSQAKTSNAAHESSEDRLKKQTSPLKTSDTIPFSQMCTTFNSVEASPGHVTQTPAVAPSQGAEPFVELSEFTELSLTGLDSHVKNPADDQAGECTASFLEPTPNADLETSTKNTIHPQTDVGLTVVTNTIHDYLDDFLRMYGTFIPLQKSDVLMHLTKMFNADFTDRTNFILTVMKRRFAAVLWEPVPSFQVVFQKHTLTLDDLSTLEHENWLNDQVMNMYGELIMEASQHKVHFLNSFFHRQLMTKGYDGVKRWTKQVDLFSKTLLLVPIHLEVHWCLVTADIARRRICLFDSQGNVLRKVARSILNYLVTEATEKQHASFVNGWAMSFDEKVPQQTNENDCGVFVLEYSRCLALDQPMHFSQRDIPKIRQRIYKELCECKLREQAH
uniref:sentrin-specific protease 5-like n=1 Tax=Doryrhamphus excisus TaxID=161450 RepID=UPI0025AE8C9F|nr:sentrin-specific protease 5-like [Doryrhamphus excisus]XP_057923265.1 sentrin-specific protease 5-like [Doryrhamphus excisus]